VSTSRTAWTAFGNAVSNAWDAVGRGLANLLDLNGGLESKLEAAKQKLQDLRSSGGLVPDINTGMLISAGPAAIDAAAAEVDKLTAALQRQKQAALDARDAQKSLAQQQAIRAALPILGQTLDLQNQLKTLQELANAPDVSKTGQSMAELQRAIAATAASLAALPKTALVDFLGAAATPAEKLAAELEQIRVKAAQIGATPEQLSRATGAAQLETSIAQQQPRAGPLGSSSKLLEALSRKSEKPADDRNERPLPKAA
jgi:hypothetical protein